MLINSRYVKRGVKALHKAHFVMDHREIQKLPCCSTHIITLRNITVLCQKQSRQAESCSNEHEQTVILMLPKACSVESAITCSETLTHTHTHIATDGFSY